jgi:CPA2 family monovalent cation:H+ antiporter-2
VRLALQSINVQFFGLLVAAVLFVWFFKRLGLPPILAYLATGILAGSHGIGWIPHNHDMAFIAELGIVFLLFSLGLEFSISRLMVMRNLVFGLGSLQVLVTSLTLIVFVVGLGFTLLSSFIIAITMALSSTAVVAKLLKETGGLNQRQGQLAIGVLLFQDIAVVPLLIVVPLFAHSDSLNIGWVLAFALIKGAFVCILLWAIGKWVLPKVFNEIAQLHTDELFVLMTLLVALLAGALTHVFGLSMALGAFLAGMMLGESQYRHQLEADIRPFRDILMGLFFVTVGMQLNILFLLINVAWILAALVGLFFCKVSIVALIALLMGERKQDAVACGIMLWQMGEFGFVLIALAGRYQLINEEHASLLIALGVLSMALTPVLIDKIPVILKRIGLLNSPQAAHFSHSLSATLYSDHIVICGFSRVGQTIARFLKLEAINYLAVESNPLLVQEGRRAGEPVFYGHVKQTDILKSAGVERARLVIITFTEFEQTQVVIDAIKNVAPKAKILIRTHDDSQLARFRALGVTEVVPETLESSLMLVSHVLSMSGVPMSRIFRLVNNERKNRYPLLQHFYSNKNHGTNDENSDPLAYIHLVTLPAFAFAVNKQINDLTLPKRRVIIKAVRRQDKHIELPPATTTLYPHDILVLQGKPRHIARVEHYLLYGID